MQHFINWIRYFWARLNDISSVQLTNRGCTDMMNAYDRNAVQKDLVDTLRRKQKIYKELPKDRSGRDDPIGREFYRRAEKEHEAVSWF